MYGHSKIDHHEIYVYPGVCIFAYGSGRGSDAYNESWVENTCVLYKSSMPYRIGCNRADLFVPYLANNTIYIQSGINIGFQCIVNGNSTFLSLEQWQALGLDSGTTVQTVPDVQTIIQWGREMLQAAT